jgi:hypothetical protein
MKSRMACSLRLGRGRRGRTRSASAPRRRSSKRCGGPTPRSRVRRIDAFHRKRCARRSIAPSARRRTAPDVAWPLRPFARFLEGDIFDAASAGVNARGNHAGFAVARRRCPWVGSDVHSFPSAACLFCLQELFTVRGVLSITSLRALGRNVAQAVIKGLPPPAAFRST